MLKPCLTHVTTFSSRSIDKKDLYTVLKLLEGYFGVNFLILSCGQMTKATLEPSAPSLNFHHGSPAGGRLNLDDRFAVHQHLMQGGSLMEPGKCGFVVSSWFRGQRILGLKPSSTTQFGEGGVPAQVLSSTSDSGSKLRCPPQNRSRYASKTRG
ncbi:hypothetical protein AVEN_260124-1 [Araneus ventricosus]|uniref:Uncharacterized protein n=1 Tax=Araneus ventricosus TaxID=182803 RepID=A0A4Y2DIJ0_ARAVE|nr:hypothetical protein AVEN_260124-1 [Araneus ventricosus]